MSFAWWLAPVRCLCRVRPTARRPRRVRRQGPRSFRPALEALENRTLLAIVSWVQTAGGDWSDAANWSGGHLPGPGDDAIIDVPGITVTHNAPVDDAINSLVCTGTLDLARGSLSPATQSALNDLRLSGGRLGGAGDLTVEGLFTWTAGTLGGGGQCYALGGMIIGGDGAKTLDGRTLNNAGDAVWTGADVAAAGSPGFNNWGGATFRVQTAAHFGGTFNNAGSFTLDVGGATVFVDTFTNSGTVQLQGNTLNAENYLQTGGTTDLGGGALASVVAVVLMDGSLRGPGSVQADLFNGGQVAPGGPGMLHVLGDYTQTDTGVLVVRLGGIAAGRQFDQLVIDGNATLGGRLEVSFLEGFRAGPGDAFPIMTFASVTGGFASTDGLTAAGSRELTATYHSGDLTLVADTTLLDSQPQDVSPGTADPVNDVHTVAADAADDAPGANATGLDAAPGERAPHSLAGGGGGVVVDISHPELAKVAHSEVVVADNSRPELAKDAHSESPPTSATTVSSPWVGAAIEEFTGAGADLFEVFVSSLDQVDLAAEKGLLSGMDIAGSLLTGAKLTPDLLPQKGSEAAPVATLLDGGDRAEEAPGADPAGEKGGGLKDWLVDPVAPFPSPRATPAPLGGKAIGEGAGETSSASDEVFRQFMLPVVCLLGLDARGVRGARSRRRGLQAATDFDVRGQLPGG